MHTYTYGTCEGHCETGLVFYMSGCNMAHLSVHTWHRWC